MLTQKYYISVVIPYRMKAVSVFNLATKYVMQWQNPKAMEIRFGGQLAIRGYSTAFTNPAIEAGVIHCRALLEFLGLKCSGTEPNRLVQRKGKKTDDYVVEDFSGPNGPLAKVTPDQAVAPYEGPKEEAERALAAIIHCANKGLAHMTKGHVVDQGDIRLFDGSRGVPTLVANYFYVAQGLSPPQYELTSSVQESA